MNNDKCSTFENSMKIPVVEPNLAQGYQAVCNGHIGGWYGPCRANSSDANSDKTTHDNSSHGGDSWAVVLRRTC